MSPVHCRVQGDTEVCLVVLCGEKPTKSLLERIATNLPAQLKEVAPDDLYEVAIPAPGSPAPDSPAPCNTPLLQVKRVIEAASLVISSSSSPSLSVTITLTSPLMRETAEETAAAGTVDPPDVKDQPHRLALLTSPLPQVLDHDRCISALAELRHVKWFHSRALSRHSCTVVIRILRDLCLRNPTWSPLDCWAIELLVEKVLNSAGVPLSPGDALRSAQRMDN